MMLFLKLAVLTNFLKCTLKYPMICIRSLQKFKQKTKFLGVTFRDLQYISIWQYIDTVIEYRIVIQCSMNIKVLK